VRASFADDGLKADIRSEIDAWLTTEPASAP
jgi:hypothetical protein